MRIRHFLGDFARACKVMRILHLMKLYEAKQDIHIHCLSLDRARSRDKQWVHARRVGHAAGPTRVIGKVMRGVDAGRLLCYLYGPGRANEHTDPHLVAGFGDPAELEPDRRINGSRDLRRLSGLLAQPLAAMYGTGYEKPVWHCSIRAVPGDRLLSDAEWAEVAADVMDRTGLAGRDDEFGMRWVAVRHAPDHIHIVATLARQDGGRPRVWSDFYRVREACRAAEERFGLRETAPADRTAARRPTRAETEQAHRRGWDEAPRVTLRREVCTAAAAARTEQEFFARLRREGVLVRLRVSTKNPGEITGYSVGLACHTNRDRGVVWYGGGKLAADLTLPKLRRRWSPRNAPTRLSASRRITAADWNALYERAAREARAAAAHVRRCSASDPRRGADAAWAVADVLRIAARMLRDPALCRAAEAYDRAARAPYGRIPGCTCQGERLRLVARRLAALGLTADGGYAATSPSAWRCSPPRSRTCARPSTMPRRRPRRGEPPSTFAEPPSTTGPAPGRRQRSACALPVQPAWMFRPDSQCPGRSPGSTRHRVGRPGSDPPRAARDRRRASPRKRLQSPPASGAEA
jgi:hypothetical protein